jgi:hypothetical protein
MLGPAAWKTVGATKSLPVVCAPALPIELPSLQLINVNPINVNPIPNTATNCALFICFVTVLCSFLPETTGMFVW